MPSFFERLNYSFGNEDWHTEQMALGIKSGDRVLCITASGDRPLNLLLDDCKEVVSLDANPIQNYLLSLKIAAMHSFDFSHYLAFLGATPSANRVESFHTLLHTMDKEAVGYWLRNKKRIAQGVLYQGTIEGWTKKIAWTLNKIRGKKIRRLFEFDDLEEQKKFVQSGGWDTWLWRKIFHVALNPKVSQYFLCLTDPSLNRHLDPSIVPGAYVYDRINQALTQFLAKESILLSLLFQGKVTKEAHPPYLTKEGFDIIKRRLDRINYSTADLISYIENSPENSFDCFSLSDVASYINEETFQRLMRAVHKAARPGARFCVRECMSCHKIPDELTPAFQRNSELEQHLERKDRCFIYRFMTGTIKK